MTIDINLDTLDLVSKKTGNLVGEINGCADRVKGVSEEVSAAWQSDSSNAYITEISETAERLRRVSTSMENLSRAISQYTNNMRQIEQNITNKINQTN